MKLPINKKKEDLEKEKRAEEIAAESFGKIGRALELAFAEVLLPLGEHERVDVQRVCHVLRLDLRVIRQLHRLNLEFQRVAVNLLRPNRCCHGDLLIR